MVAVLQVAVLQVNEMTVCNANAKHAAISSSYTYPHTVGPFFSSTATCLGPRWRLMACCGQSGADRFDAGETEDRRAARAAPRRLPRSRAGSRARRGGKGSRPPSLGEQPRDGRQIPCAHRPRVSPATHLMAARRSSATQRRAPFGLANE